MKVEWRICIHTRTLSLAIPIENQKNKVLCIAIRQAQAKRCTYACSSVGTERSLCTDSCVQDRRYRSGCTHSRAQVRTYRLVCTGSCVQARRHRQGTRRGDAARPRGAGDASCFTIVLARGSQLQENEAFLTFPPPVNPQPTS